MFKLAQYRQGVRRLVIHAVCLMMVSVAAWGGVSVRGVSMPSAIAVGSQSAADVVNSRAAAELDRVAGEGTSDKFAGTAQEETSKIKRDVGRLRLDADGTDVDQMKGKMKRNVGEAKGAAAEAGDDIKEGASGVVESIKDFFD